MDKNISFTLKVWRQKGPKAKGAFETYQMKGIVNRRTVIQLCINVIADWLCIFGNDCKIFT